MLSRNWFYKTIVRYTMYHMTYLKIVTDYEYLTPELKSVIKVVLYTANCASCEIHVKRD